MTVKLLKFANNASSTLALPLNTTATSCTLATGTGALYPNPGMNESFLMTLSKPGNPAINEIVLVTGRSGDTITQMARQQEGTAPGGLSWLVGDFASCECTAGTQSSFVQFYTLALSSGAGLVGFIQSLTNSVARTVQSKLGEFLSWFDFGVTGDGSTDDQQDINNALSAGSSHKTLALQIPATSASYKSSKTITVSGGYSTVLKGDSWPGAQINFTQTDGTDCVVVAPRSTDGDPVYIGGFGVNGGSQTGDGVKINGGTGGQAASVWDLFVKGISATNKAALRITTSFIGTLRRIWLWNSYYGLKMEGSNGIGADGLWIADNKHNVDLDNACIGNDLGITELGLSTLDVTKQAYQNAGNNNRMRVKFLENFTMAQSLHNTSTSYSNIFDGENLGAMSIFEEGYFNINKIGDNIPFFNVSGMWDLCGPMAGSAWDLQNLFMDSQFQNSGALPKFHGYGATPATPSVDTTWGFPYGNNLLLDWGTSAQSGCQSDRTWAVTAGQWFTCIHAFQINRAQATDERLFINVLGGGGQTRLTAWMPGGLQSNQTYFVAVVGPMVASENVSLRIGMTQDSATTHSALQTKHSGFTVMLNKRFLTILPSGDDLTRTLATKGVYSPYWNFGVANVEVAPTKFGRASGIVFKTNTIVDSLASTADAIAYSYGVDANEMYIIGSACRVHFWGRTAANGDSKEARIVIAGTTVIDTTAIAANNKPWSLWAEVSRYDTGNLSVHCWGSFNGVALPETDLFVVLAQKSATTIELHIKNSTATAADISAYGGNIEALP